MTGMSLFLIGSVAVCNIGFVVYLLLDHNKKVAKSGEDAKPEPPAEPEQPKEAGNSVLEGLSLMGKSTFDIEKEIRSSIEKVVTETISVVMPGAIEKFLGDVKLKDVVFANKEDEPTAEEVAKDEQEPYVPTKTKQMSAEQEAAAFNDVRINDVEPDEVSAPSASGASMEDIEDSFNIAVDENSTPAQKVRAGKVLEKLLDTEFVERFTSEPEIYRNILICVKESIKADMAMEAKDKTKPEPTKPEPRPAPKPVKSRKTTVVITTNLDDFNPADLLK